MSDPAAAPQFDARSWVDRISAGTSSSRFRPWGAVDDEPADAEDLVAEEPEIPLPDPAALRAEGFAEGFEQGRRTVIMEISDERAAIIQLAQSLEALRPEPTHALAALLAETVERLVREIVGSVAMDPALFVDRAAAAASLIGEEVEPSRLLVNPDDLPLLADADLPVALTADASLPRGSIKLECASGWLEDGPAVRLDRLKAALDRMGGSE